MPRETEFLLAVLALATVAPPPTGANAQTASDKLASRNLFTASERSTTISVKVKTQFKAE